MDFDDPTKPEFATWQSYNNFARQVSRNRRYVWGAEVTAFLDTVRATIPNLNRDVVLKQGMILYRAQKGIYWREDVDDDGNNCGEQPVGFGRDRMKPRLNRAHQGRANPAGIPVLYLGTSQETAISEVRPWIGADISVAQFQILRELKAINLSLGHGKSNSGVALRNVLYGEPASRDDKEEAVWIDIDNAFSRPVTSSDDAADYVPTQILAEFFRSEGYEAIVYKSQFGENGFNVALFDVDDANAINCVPYEVTEIEVKFKEAGNRWYATKEISQEGK